MRSLRRCLAGAVTVVLLNGFGGGALADEDYSQAGTWVSLVQSNCGPTNDGEFTYQADGAYLVRDLAVRCDALDGDPRLGDVMRLVLNEDCFADGGCINWGTIEQEGPDGTWYGHFAGAEDPGGDANITFVMTGTGAYEGLSHIRHATGPFAGPLDHAGVVYQGDLPPLLAMDEPPAE